MAFQNACRVSKIFNSPVRTRTNANLIKLFAFKLCNWHDVIDSMRFSNQRNDSIGVYVNLLSIHSVLILSLIHISEPTRLLSISYAVFCLKKNKQQNHT